MDAEEVLTLLDTYWFNQEIITNKPISPNHHLKTQSSTQQIPTKEPPKNPVEISPLPSRHVRSHSDYELSSKSSSVLSDFESPKSVLISQKLQTILSGKHVTEGIPYKEDTGKPSKNKVMMSRMRKNRGSSKSLSDLEFDELKGFMDLGFVFREDDKNSSTLVSIIPGLQRFGIKRLEGEIFDEKSVGHESLISRPYLSEAWDVFDQRKEEKPLMNWRIPALRSEIDMKDHLKIWAHTVASTVR